jgi:putative peptidoglycan lipid II flippase
MLLAAFFGTGSEMDYYLKLASFPTMLAGIFGSALSYSLIPYLIIKKDSLSNYDYNVFFNDFMIFLTKILTVISLFGIFFTILYTDFMSFSVPNSQFLIILLWSIFFLSILMSVLNCYYNAKLSFLFPILMVGLQYVFSIISVYFLATYIGILSILIGLFFGNIIAVVILFLKKKHFSKSKLVVQNINEIKLFFKGIKYTAVAMLTFSIFQFIDSFWTNNLAESSMSYLGYSQRLLIAFGSIIIVGPSTVLIPRLTIALKENRYNDYYNDSVLIIKIVFTLTSFVSVLVYLFSKEIISVLFQRGEFVLNSTVGVSEVLSIMIIGMNFMLSVVIIFRILFIQQINKKIAVIGFITTSLYFILSGIFIGFFDVLGIAYAYVITWFIVFVYSIKLLFKENHFLLNKKNLSFIIKHFLTLLCVFLCGLIIKNRILSLINYDSLFEKLCFLIFSLLFLFSIYGFISLKLLKIDEFSFFVKNIYLVFRSKKAKI